MENSSIKGRCIASLIILHTCQHIVWPQTCQHSTVSLLSFQNCRTKHMHVQKVQIWMKFWAQSKSGGNINNDIPLRRVLLFRIWPAKLQSAACCLPLKPHYKARSPHVSYCASSLCSLGLLQFSPWRSQEEDSLLLQEKELSGEERYLLKQSLSLLL